MLSLSITGIGLYSLNIVSSGRLKHTLWQHGYKLTRVCLHCVSKKHVTTFSTITLTIGVRLQ